MNFWRNSQGILTSTPSQQGPEPNNKNSNLCKFTICKHKNATKSGNISRLNAQKFSSRSTAITVLAAILLPGSK